MVQKKSTSVEEVTLDGVSINEFERAYDKIQEWFFAFPEEEFSLNDIAEALGIAKTSANIVVSQFVDDGFLTLATLGKLWRIKANQQHHWFTKRKIPFNLRLIYESGIFDWVEQYVPSAKAIILFGSYRKGDDIKTSDLDIAVEIPEENELSISKARITELGYRKYINVNFHIFSRKKVDINLFANIANGIVLKGFLEVKP
ncbi:nucleotidyltransferase domain-containing protein [Candidatus Woesearchaeota archaeon]|nr:nucleotidyltransferase domain-containing protein [Candidatus Woesearchaeota archaeon]